MIDLVGPGAARLSDRAFFVHGDALAFVRGLPDRCLHAVVTDPPYGAEFEEPDLKRLRAGRGGVWRIPPALGGVKRSPVPRFTVLGEEQIARMCDGFRALSTELRRVLVPGAHVLVASNPLVSTRTFQAFADGGLEPRGTVVRLVQTLRGGDRPKNAHQEFPDVTVMPRSGFEPWGLFRVPLEGTVAENLRRWGTGALRRPSPDQPFRDVIACPVASAAERRLAPHPSLKPQRLLRQLARAVLPLGEGVVLDPFAGSGSTVAACLALGQAAIGVERDEHWHRLAVEAIPRLAALP